MSRIVENNQVTISGEIISGFRFSHETFGEGFYIADIKVDRLSENFDIIPVMVSDRLFEIREDCTGAQVNVTGQFRSFNRHEDSKNRLLLYVFAIEIEFVDQIVVCHESNSIYLDGYICKKPSYRKTPFGREIADLLLAVNRPYGKSDYIPCICWGRNAIYASRLNVGEKCRIWGRIQSREYMKKIDEQQSEKRVAYEVSASKLEVHDDEE